MTEAMRTIPETGFVRLPQVLAVIPLGKTCWWEGVRSGRFPKPIKLSARCTAWRAEDIHGLIRALSEQAPEITVFCENRGNQPERALQSWSFAP